MSNIILLLGFLLSISWVNGQTLHRDLLIMDCNGNVNMFPGSKLFSTKFYIGDMLEFYNYAHEEILFKKLQCKCPNVQMEEFNRRFAIHTWDFWLNILTGTDEVSECAKLAPEWDQSYNVTKDIKVKMDLASCTYANWKAGDDCLLKMAIPLLGVDFQLAIGHCPNSHFPYVSITCQGESCDTVGTPCNDDKECSSKQTCFKIPANVTNADLFRGFVSAYLYDNNDDSPGSYPGSELFTTIFDEIRVRAFGIEKGYTFAANAPTLDFKLCSYVIPPPPPSECSTTYDEFGYPYTTCVYPPYDPIGSACSANTTDANNNTILKCGAIQDWDGKLADGSSVMNESRLNGEMEGLLTFDDVPENLISANAVPLIYHSCSNDMRMFPQGAHGLLAHLFTSYSSFFQNLEVGNSSNGFMISSFVLDGVLAMSDFRAKFPVLNNVADVWYNANLQWQQRRAKDRGGELSRDDYEIRFGWMLPYALTLLENSNLKFTPAMSDWITSIGWSYEFTLPDTCKYDHYAQTTECTAQFTGLQSLIDSDITINILIKDCPYFDIPAIYMECEGNDCFLLKKLQPCKDDSDCTGYPGTKCLSMANSKKIDFIQAFFTHKYNPVDSCGSADSLLGDLKNLFSHYNTVDAAEDSLCFWDVENLIKTVNVTQWAETQFKIDGSTISIKDLSSWEPANTDIPGSEEEVGSQSSSSLISFSWLFFLLAFLTWTL